MSRRRGLLHPQGYGGLQFANVGDIAYKAANSKVMVVASDAWSTSLGTPVGVVVIPSGFAPDNGLARIMSLYWGSASGTGSTSIVSIYWRTSNGDTPLPNYDGVPITDNKDLIATGAGSFGCLPSDNIVTGPTSYVDPVAKYDFEILESEFIPSPYLGDKPNPAYYSPISGYNNALADFDGKGNTDILVALGADYMAANAARNYKAEGAEEITWYLPAMGELGYSEVRRKKISEALAILGVAQFENGFYWSSTEYSYSQVYYLETYWDAVSKIDKGTAAYVRPFAQLDF